MKVLRIIARLNVGGPARHVTLLNRGLQARGHQTLLVHGLVDEGEKSFDDLAADLPNEVIPELGRRVSPLSDLRALARIVRTVFRERPDVVHTHTAKAGTLGRIAAAAFNATRPRRRRCLVVHTFHGHVLDGYFSPGATALVREVERLLARVTDRIVTISAAQRNDIVDRFHVGHEATTVVIPLGLDLDALFASGRSPAARREFGFDERAIVFGYVGRLVPIKALPTLIDAFARVRDAVPNAHLFLAGDGPERPRLEALVANRNLAGSVRLLGWRADLANLYSAMDVCVLSSRNEGTPVAVIEAMAAGIPVVATRVGGVADVIGNDETGLLVPAASVDELAAAMIRLAGDPSLRAVLGRTGRGAARQYDWRRLVDDTERLYIGALSEKRA